MASTPSAASTATSLSAGVPTGFALDPSVADFHVTLAAFLKTCPSLNSVCVGAFVFDESNRLLIVQRAAHDSYPLRWEIPGGSIDAEDETILHGLAREVWEETGLRCRFVSRLADRYTFSTRRLLRVCKYTFFVDVGGYDVRLDPNEHAAFLWVTEEEAKMKRCGGVHFSYTTKSQEDAILAAFRTRRGQVGV